MTTAEQIRKALKRKKMSRVEFVEKLEISKSTVSDWLRGNHEPNLDSLRKIAEVLGCKVHELIGSDPNETAS